MNRTTVLNSFLQNNSLDLLLEAVSLQLGCPVIVTDNAFHIVSSFAAKGFDDMGYRKAVSHSELPLSACGEISKSLEKSENDRVFAETNGKKVGVSVLKSGGVSLGYIIYILFEADEPNESDCVFCESLIAKQFYTDRRTNGFAFDTAEEILIELLDGKYSSNEVFQIKAAGTFLSSFAPDRVALISLSSDKLRNEHLARSLSQSFHASHPLFYGGKLLLFLHKDHDADFLRSFINEYELCAVLSQKLESLFSLQRVYAELCGVLDYLKNKKPPFLENSIDYRLLLLLKKSVKDFGFADERIRKIFEYDQKNSGELCLTLYTYLICRHSLLETCERLFTHRNTVQYRIRKVRDDFEIDTDNPDGQLRLLLSLSAALIMLGKDELFIASNR